MPYLDTIRRGPSCGYLPRIVLVASRAGNPGASSRPRSSIGPLPAARTGACRSAGHAWPRCCAGL